MKAFFEEYGLVIMVTIIAVGMIAFADTFKGQIEQAVSSQWNSMIERSEAQP